MPTCDAETGVCRLPESSEKSAPHRSAALAGAAVRYIGDPMCSWCWGISPALKELAAYCQSHGLDFTVHVGGLRPGGGDEWTAAFKTFLRHEWENIHRVTGQPFGFTLLDQDAFTYDTEPACRAVVAMERLLKNGPALLAFFSGIQRRFYVEGADPKQPEFYRDLCAEAGVSHAEFLNLFHAPEVRSATLAEFQRCRSWGIRGFPSIVLDAAGRITPLASGYMTAAAILETLDRAVATSPMPS